jgi:hypothetical protein
MFHFFVPTHIPYNMIGQAGTKKKATALTLHCTVGGSYHWNSVSQKKKKEVNNFKQS